MISLARTFVRVLSFLAVAAPALVACKTAETIESIQQPAVIEDANFADSVFVTGLQGPTTMAFAPDGRLFVSEKDGALRVIKNNQLLTTPFVTLAVDTGNERGLMGVAFDPNFASNHYLYVYYTSTAGSIHNRLSRFTANGDVAATGSELVLADFPTLGAANHNGGAVHFGTDGKLYVSLGENAVSSNAQSMSTPLGKMLRFNADGTIPTDNPFYASTTGINRAIWALGLRNPFTFAVQPGSGTIFINDVGEGGWESIERGQAGANYGWPTTGDGPFTGQPQFTQPFHAYPHGAGNAAGNCIAGGTFYNPAVQAFPSSYLGQYFFADYNNNWIRRIDPNTGTHSLFASTVPGPVDLDVGPDGALYYLARGAGQVGRIAYTASLPPSIAQHPSNTLVSVGYPATFTVSASGEPPLTYQWQRNGTPIAGATSSSYTLSSAQLSDSGATFRAVVTNNISSTTSNAATLTVTTNQPPVATISTPTSGATYSAGTNLAFSGTATDTEDGSLPASAYTWNITFHHGTHTHPAMSDTSGITSGSWPIGNGGEVAADVWFRVYLTVRDSIGLSHTTFRDVVPVTVPLTLATNPAGLSVTLEGQPQTTPINVTSVVGVTRLIGTDSPQYANNKFWAFSSWSDGGAQSHQFNTPGSGTTYTATFTETSGGSCYRIQSERTDKWLTVNAANEVVASTTTQANGEIFQLVPSGTKFKLKRGQSGSFMGVVADKLTMSASFSVAEQFTQQPCGYGGRTRVGFTASSGTAPNWKETNLDAAIASGNAGNGAVCNAADGGSWEGFYLEAATCPGSSGAVCGNGAVESGEQCDDGNTSTEACAYGQTSCTVCGASCTNVAGATSYCGNGSVAAANGEQCDDGNTTSGDGCSATCQTESTGGGSCYRIQSERSDKWLTVDGTSKVKATTTTQSSGEIFELVASGGQVKLKGQSGAYMAVVTDQLTMNATVATAALFTQQACGYGGRTRVGFTASSGTAPNWKETTLDGPIQSGNAGNGGVCNAADGGSWEAFYLEPATCPGGSSPVCGNGVVESGEQCDDGNTVTETCPYSQTSCSVCSATCANVGGATSYCGDGALDGAHGEQCDDGNAACCDGCGATCLTESGGPVQLTISSSTSGAYQTAPSLSYDGDQNSRYTNDGNLASASIVYTLSASASLSKVKLLMFNGASRTYPLQIKVGTTTVFTGSTTLGAGFIEIPFNATTGTTLTITMTGANSAGSNWFSIFETQIFGTP
jgi:cysteine-rich repeat protein